MEFEAVVNYFKQHFTQVHKRNNENKRVLYTHLTSVVVSNHPYPSLTPSSLSCIIIGILKNGFLTLSLVLLGYEGDEEHHHECFRFNLPQIPRGRSSGVRVKQVKHLKARASVRARNSDSIPITYFQL